ncbi:MAG: hypothetical protein AB8B71_17640 [Paracoccaceae bacterium]
MNWPAVPIILAALTSCATPAVAQSDEQAQSAFTTADIDASRDLDPAEFRTFIVEMARLGHTEAKRAVRLGAIGFRVAFRNADQDRNGQVTLQELQRIR